MWKKKRGLVSFVLISLVLALFFACAISGAGMWAGEAEESKNPHQAEKDNGAVSEVNVTASSTTCNSCSDCTNKLNGEYDTAILTRDLINVKGYCITFGANNVVFNGNGHRIDGDNTGEFESGITMSSKSGNTEKKPDLRITDIICDSEKHRIGYKIKNIGAATASKRHYTTLFVDGAFKIKEQVNVDLAPKASSQRYFDYYSWECTLPQDNVKVCADYGDFVDESNEENNCREETCECVVEKSDLVITDIWNVSNKIYYKVKNQGKATAGVSYTSLFIDGVFKVKDYVAPLASGATRTESFNYQWACTPPSDMVKVCADYLNGVAESNEKNNCKTETYVCIEKPDLIITDIQCDNKKHRIGYKIKNIGAATASKGHYTTLFVDGAFKIKEQVNVNLAPGASSQRYFDYYSWQCTTPQDNVKVCADYGDFVDESNEQNNCREKTCECAPPEKPDLIITDVWNEDSTICYQVRNIGNATAPKGHYTALSIDGEPVVNDLVDVELAPKERLKQCFNYGWQCSPPDDTITVCADYKDVVDEADETNNCRNETWKCDTTPPVIISGPTVSEITPSSVTIAWTTDEDSDSLVRFGRTAGKYEDQKSGMKMKQEHKLLLTDLLPSTTYRYVVQSTDASENTVVSRDGFFETGPVPDDEPPVISSLNITRGKGDFLYYEMSADASDNIGVERVEFYIDDRHIGTDYSAPYWCYMTPASIEMTWAEFLEEHTVKVIACDDCRVLDYLVKPFDPPYECERISMAMSDPDLDYTIYIEGDTVPAGTIVPIEVYADAALEQGRRTCVRWLPDGTCGSFSFSITIIEPISNVEFYVNHAPISSTRSNYVHTGNWDASGFPPGIYTIRVDAIASEGCKQTITREVSIEVGEPSLNVRREVTRTDNCFQVALTVRNHRTATASAQLDRIGDNVDGFQPIRKRDNSYEVTTETSNNGRDCDVEINLFNTGGDTITLSPGGHFTVEYLAVPILYGSPVEYAIGAEDVTVHHSDGSTESFNRPYVPTDEDEPPLSSSVDAAVGSSDYLIVTNPSRLFTFNIDAEVNVLLSEMAHLAYLKQGVLGYLETTTDLTTGNLIEPDGGWASQLHSKFSTTLGGYLLIVGEMEIVSSWHHYGFDRHWSSGGVTDAVHFTDHPYADTTGDGAPDLIVGRIVGNSAAALTNPIQTSIGVHEGLAGFGFDRSLALLVSGTGCCESDFVGNVNEVKDILDDEFAVDKIHWTDYTTDAQRHNAFIWLTLGRDVLYYSGHGNIDAWGSGLGTSQFPLNFGYNNPFVFAPSCLTGDYQSGDDYNIAEAFFDSGAAVYIGSTQLSPVSKNLAAGERFFNNWDASESIGYAFTDMERNRWSHGDWWRFWVYEYNLYGDPKFGAVSSADEAAMMSSSTGAQEPPSSLKVEIPDYVVTTRDKRDYVEIPGGDLLLEEGEYRIPYYTVSIDYPRGYKVQDVVLTERSGLVAATGLNIPITTMDIASSIADSRVYLTKGEGWFPEEEYRWTILENPDGSTTLLIMMYPFYYNHLTTDVEFYKNYTFEINYTTSTVEIAALTTDTDVYRQGDDVLVNLWLNNSGDTQDVLVDAVVKAGGSGEIVDGLLLRTLKEFAGHASFSPHWDSSGIEPGYYFVEVTLKDTGGNVLDRKTEMFRLGISSGEITNFTATPEYFDIGDDIEINMAFNNTGTVNITGTAITKIKNSTGYAVEEFRHNVTDLTPSESISFSDTWNTSGAEESSYKILGYVLYESTTTEPVSVTVSAQAKIFDTGPGTYPSVMGNHTGIIKPNHTVIATKMYTYPCSGTGGHTEYARIWNDTWNATATWEGYAAKDWHNVTFDKTVVLLPTETYNYCIHTGSYPQIHHTDELKVDDGTITCDKFVDANGKVYYDRIPAIKLFV